MSRELNMKIIGATFAVSSLGAWAANAQDVASVSPALEKYTRERLLGEVWKRPGLSTRDRSIVTLAVLVARNQTVEMGQYVNLALDSGVKPAEISELITHLAYYSGWSNAMSAVGHERRLCQARHSSRRPAAGITQASATGRGERSKARKGRERAIRRRRTGGSAVHHRRPLP